MRSSRMFLVLALSTLAACTPSIDSDESEENLDGDDELSMPCPQNGCPAFCAIAGFDGPAFYAMNFSSYGKAKVWLNGFPDATSHEIVDGPCAAPVVCPDYYDPFCGVVSGGEQQTFGNACELLGATRNAAGQQPPDGAKGAFQYDGECKAAQDQCAGQPCGTPCEGPFASPLPTACDGNGACVPQPTCESYDCDQSHIICDIPIVPCDEGEAHSVDGACYGECVPVSACKCDPADPNDCPEGYVCWANTGHCGPYVGN